MIIEPIQIALSVAGKDLVFPTFTVKGIASFDVYNLRGGEDSVYHASRRNFSFRLSSQDVKTHSISEDDTFYISDGIYRYNFTVADLVIDLTSWTDLSATFTNLVSL